LKFVNKIFVKCVLEYRTVNEISDDLIIEQIESSNQPSQELGSKPSSTRPGRSGLVYDESNNQWDAEELERKQKNPYRWFIEKQREKAKAKGPSQDEKAASAMVISFIVKIQYEFLHFHRKHDFGMFQNSFVIGYTILGEKQM
jgi:hypothetical protein